MRSVPLKVIFQQIGQAIFFIEFYDFSVFLYPYRMYRVLFILFCSTFALTHTAACVGLRVGLGGGWRECVVHAH